MPDLTKEAYWQCTTAETWAMDVRLSPEKKAYTVTWDRWRHLRQHDVVYDYSCTCKAYKYGKGVHCKHIERAKTSRCGWMQFLDGEDVAESSCPRCGAEVHARTWGV
jgi:hypothetical protein